MNNQVVTTPTKIDSRLGTAAFLVLAFVYLYLTLFRLPATPIFFENDHFIQMYDSVRMLNGEVLYRDFFQFTFPGTEVWYLILFNIFGQQIWLLNATILALGLSITAAILAISKRLMTGPYIYIAPAIFLFFGFRWYGMDGGHRLFSCLFATLAIMMLIDRATYLRLIAAGVFCALSAFFTQNRGIGIFAGLMVFLLWRAFQWRADRGLSERLQPMLTVGAAFVVTLLLLTGYFMITAGPATFVESTLLFARRYNADPLNNSDLYLQFWHSLFAGKISWSSLPVDLFYYLLVPAVYLIPIGYYILRRPLDRELWSKVLLLSVSGIFLFLVTTGLNSVRLYHVAIPGLVLLAMWFYKTSFRAISLAGAGAVTLAAFALLIWGQIKHYPTVTQLPVGTVVFTSDNAGEKYRWLNEQTQPGDVVFEAYRSVVNFPLKLRNPTSFAMLRSNDYTPPEHVQTVISQLRAQPPKYILWDGKWSAKGPDAAAAGHLGPLYNFLTEHYRLRETLTPLFEFNIEVWEQATND